jgi:hypothetical protein
MTFFTLSAPNQWRGVGIDDDPVSTGVGAGQGQWLTTVVTQCSS